MEREIGRYCCLKEIRHTLPEDRKIQSAFIRLIITEKTFGGTDTYRSIDPIIPEFNYEPSIVQFKKEIIDAKIPNLSENEEIVDDLIYKIKNIARKFLSKKRAIDQDKLKSYMDEAGKNYIFEYSRLVYDKRNDRGRSRGRGGNRGGRGGRSSNQMTKPFKITIPKELCDYLKDRAENGEDFKNSIFMVWLRYLNLSNWDDMYQLRINSGFYKLLKAEFNISLELMSSPINSQFPLYGSLFYDTDKHFGSLGSYVDLIKNPNISGMIEINPPYIEMIQIDIIQKIDMEMSKEDRELGFILFLAYWPENQSFIDTLNSKYLRKSFIPGKMTDKEAKLIFDFYSDQDGKFYNVSKKTCMFVLQNDKLWERYGDEKINKIFDF